jgi:hypothetical protein
MSLKSFYETTYKYGADPFNGGSSSSVVSLENVAERKVKLKLAEEKIKQDIKDQPKIDRCINDLGGEVITNPDGSKVCQWYNHTVKEDQLQTIPLSQCGDYLIDGLWIPSKEAVLKARPKLKKELGIK